MYTTLDFLVDLACFGSVHSAELGDVLAISVLLLFFFTCTPWVLKSAIGEF